MCAEAERPGYLKVVQGASKSSFLMQMRQQISLKQGALAPLAASAALFGGFLLIKYLPGLNLQVACNIYFWIIGSAAVTGALGPPLRRAVRCPPPFPGTILSLALVFVVIILNKRVHWRSQRCSQSFCTGGEL